MRQLHSDALFNQFYFVYFATKSRDSSHQLNFLAVSLPSDYFFRIRAWTFIGIFLSFCLRKLALWFPYIGNAAGKQTISLDSPFYPNWIYPDSSLSATTCSVVSLLSYHLVRIRVLAFIGIFLSSRWTGRLLTAEKKSFHWTHSFICISNCRILQKQLISSDSPFRCRIVCRSTEVQCLVHWIHHIPLLKLRF